MIDENSGRKLNPFSIWGTVDFKAAMSNCEYLFRHVDL